MSKYYKFFSVLLTVLLVYFLFRSIHFGDVVEVLKKVRWEFLVVAFLAYLLMNWTRARRFYELLQRQVRFSSIFPIGFVHSFLNSILPARSGELSYVYYINKSGVELGKNITSLLVARFFDVLTVIAMALIALPLLAGSLNNTGSLVLAMAVGFATLLTVVIFLVFWETRVLWVVGLLFSVTRLNRLLIGQKILAIAQSSLSAFRQLRDPKLFFSVTWLTFANWTLVALVNFLLVRGFGLELNFGQAVFLSSVLPILIGLVPYAIGNLGVFEGSAALALVVLGFDRAAAVSFGFVLHIVEILIPLTPAVVSYYILSRSARKGVAK